jgi:hypothetical protein
MPPSPRYTARLPQASCIYPHAGGTRPKESEWDFLLGFDSP